ARRHSACSRSSACSPAAFPLLQSKPCVKASASSRSRHSSTRVSCGSARRPPARRGSRCSRSCASTHSSGSKAQARLRSSAVVVSSALVNLGNLAFYSGDLDAARYLYKESIEHFESLGDLRGQALAKENVGLMALTVGDVPEAMTWLTEALALAREGNDDREIAAAARSLAAAALELGEPAHATDLLAESLGLARELGETHGIAVCLETFAGLAAAADEAERAAILFGASDAVRTSIGAQRQPDHQILYDRWLARTLAHLDTKTYSKLYEDGRMLTVEGACALALRAEPAPVA